jgi:hypothetical protein
MTKITVASERWVEYLQGPEPNESREILHFGQIWVAWQLVVNIEYSVIGVIQRVVPGIFFQSPLKNHRSRWWSWCVRTLTITPTETKVITSAKLNTQRCKQIIIPNRNHDFKTLMVRQRASHAFHGWETKVTFPSFSHCSSKAKIHSSLTLLFHSC